MKYKKSGFIFYLDMIQVSLLLLTFSGGFVVGNNLMMNHRVGLLKTECRVIDISLENWAKFHTGVDTTSITTDAKGNLKYEKLRQYPQSLSDLGELQNQGFLAYQIDMSKFQYSTNTDENGRMTYRLEVELPDETIYTSLGSEG